MKKVNFKKVLKQVKAHADIMLRGLARMIYGTLIAGLLAFAIYGFVLIKSEGGYAAVFDFIAACATLILALANAYLLGSKRRGAKK
jgi:predicted lipid-binding transport protein (Tim44 family)